MQSGFVSAPVHPWTRVAHSNALGLIRPRWRAVLSDQNTILVRRGFTEAGGDRLPKCRRVHSVPAPRQVLDLLREEKMLVMQGTGFNWPSPDHLRIVTLPRTEVLEDAIARLARFLQNRAAN